jgi:hypothetical protein
VKEFSQILNNSAEWAKSAPWNAVKHFSDPVQAAYQYEENRKEISRF